MPPHHLRSALSVLQLVTFAMLLRSIALDRWITVVASVLLLIGAVAAGRGRTWGVVLSFALGATFAGLWALGVAPLGFVLVAVVSMRPFASLWSVFSRFDRGAAATLAALSAGLGALGAVAWKEYAHALFRALPILAPSVYPHHGLAIATLAAATVAGLFMLGRRSGVAQTRAQSDADATESPVRVSAAHDAAEADALAEIEAELEEVPARPRARLR